MKLIKHLVRALIAASLFGAAMPAMAVVIEGTTPSGKFKTAGLDEQGNFRVAVGSGTPQHIIVDSSVPVYAVNPFPVTGIGGTPVIMQGSIAGTPIPVTVNGTFAVTASTAINTTSSQGSVNGASTLIYPADPLRKQGCVCNNGTDSQNLWVGPSGVTTASGVKLTVGSCLCPDTPSSYTGSLYGASTTTVQTSYIYFY
jgi:hypothetical protein